MEGEVKLLSIKMKKFLRIFFFVFDKLMIREVEMNKIEVFNEDGKTRDERETCFPSTPNRGQKKGACTR